MQNAMAIYAYETEIQSVVIIRYFSLLTPFFPDRTSLNLIFTTIKRDEA